jgi:predicted MFS family arabinose efflux permease
VGTFVGIGASLSATLAGYITDHFGSPAAFTGLAGIAAVGFTVAWLLMPETRTAPDDAG